MKEPKLHVHPENMTARIYGAQLETGDIVQADDLYNSSGGNWQSCPCPGLTITMGVSVIWVRPMEQR